jgi:hypothetical protein
MATINIPAEVKFWSQRKEIKDKTISTCALSNVIARSRDFPKYNASR